MIRDAIRKITIDRKHRLPRKWSNDELAQFAGELEGDVVNVSAWRDEDKFGRHYRDYFTRARSYTLTNYKEEARGFQGTPGEIFLDLEARELPDALANNFDVVFHHTVLEHVFEVGRAMDHLCAMSRDLVVGVVPFLQPMHADYGDYWRFTPLAVRRMHEQRGMHVVRMSFNRTWLSSVYLLYVAARHPERWRDRIGNDGSHVDMQLSWDGSEPWVGTRAIPNIPRGLLRRGRRHGEH